jgi:hypothetical protein
METSVQSIAEIFVKTGWFSDVSNTAQAVVKILAGAEIGLSPIQSMQSVYVINNSEGTGIGYEVKVLLAKLKKEAKYDYKVRYEGGEDPKSIICYVDFYQDGKLLGTSDFSFLDAARIGLVNKFAYKNYPKQMLFYRAASIGLKLFCPDVLMGAAIAEEYIEMAPSKETTLSFHKETE